jgi:hypothetical protein
VLEYLSYQSHFDTVYSAVSILFRVIRYYCWIMKAKDRKMQLLRHYIRVFLSLLSTIVCCKCFPGEQAISYPLSLAPSSILKSCKPETSSLPMTPKPCAFRTYPQSSETRLPHSSSPSPPRSSSSHPSILPQDRP